MVMLWYTSWRAVEKEMLVRTGSEKQGEGHWNRNFKKQGMSLTRPQTNRVSCVNILQLLGDGMTSKLGDHPCQLAQDSPGECLPCERACSLALSRRGQSIVCFYL